jgi:hypothetical protein
MPSRRCVVCALSVRPCHRFVSRGNAAGNCDRRPAYLENTVDVIKTLPRHQRLGDCDRSVKGYRCLDLASVIMQRDPAFPRNISGSEIWPRPILELCQVCHVTIGLLMNGSLGKINEILSCNGSRFVESVSETDLVRLMPSYLAERDAIAG